jgi:tRNA(Ile)-lysidine synthase
LDAAAERSGRPLQSGDLILVACSGGPDSLALAAALAFEVGSAERADSGLRAGAVIVDHGLQLASGEVASHTAEVLGGLGLAPVEIVKVVVGEAGGPEAAARDARYAALRATAAKLGARFVLLGHTLDDQAETVLLGLARGSGARSLSGMAAVTPINGASEFLRPLLGIARETTVAFCAVSGLNPWQDPHNQDHKFTRVRVRQVVLPLLEQELGPGVAAALARSADLLRADADFLDDLANSEFKSLAVLGSTDLTFEHAQLNALAQAIRGRVLKLALAVFAAESSAAHIRSIEDLLDNWHGQKPLALPRVRVERAGEKLVFKSTKTMKSGVC